MNPTSRHAANNPLAGFRQRFVRPSTGPDKPDQADALFPDGWRRAALETAAIHEGRLDRVEVRGERAEIDTGRRATNHGRRWRRWRSRR